MITASPSYTALSPRQINPLSQLISEGIEVGNSILSVMMGSTTTTLSASSSISVFPSSMTSTILSASTPNSSTASTPSTISQASSTPTTLSSSTSQLWPTVTASHTSSQSGIGTSTNKALIIGLSIGLGLVALVLLTTAMWYWRKRSKSRRTPSFYYEKGSASLAGVDDNGLHATSEWECNPPVPEPTLPILRSLTTRTSQYEPLHRAIKPPLSQNPFLSPAELHPLARTLAPYHDSSIPYTSSEESDRSSEKAGMLVSPIAPMESPSYIPVEVEGDTGALLGRKLPPRSRAIWPSRVETSRFDFGFGQNENSGRSDATAFKVPRRPVASRRR